MINSVTKATTRAKSRTGTQRQRNDLRGPSLNSTRQVKPNGKLQKELKTVLHKARHQMPQEYAGIVGSKQLDAIRSITEEVKERRNETENHGDLLHYDIQEKTLSKVDDAIINSVMQQVAQLNKDKLSEESLVKVLTSVYLDAKSKLTEKDRPILVSTSSCDHLTNKQIDRATEKLIDDSGVNGKTPEPEDTHPSSEQHLSFGERKRLQWERERAELAALTAHDPWSKTSTTKSPTAIQSLSYSPTVTTGPQVLVSCSSPVRSPLSQSPLIPSVTQSYSDPPFSVSTSAPPALTPMAFAMHEESELQKREEQRRQWKAELDRQVLDQRMLQERLKLEEQRKQEAILNQMRLQSFAHAQLPAGNTSSPMSYPVLGPTEAHPSASHFTSQNALASTLSPAAPSDISFPPGSFASAALSSTVPLDSSGFGTFGSANTAPVGRTAFNRTRGFTQQLYADPAANAERARLAHEARMANLQQIEEKRRQREEEKARRLLEEKLEEERIARERAQMKAIADAEEAARRQREQMERQHVEQLHQNLFEARKAAEQQKSLRFAMHTRPGAVIPSSFDVSQTVVPAVTMPLALNHYPLPDSTQPACLAETIGLSTDAPPPMTMSNVLPSTSTVLMPPQVPMVSSSGVQTASVEDAQIQTEPIRQTTGPNGLVPRCALQRGTGPRRANEPTTAAQPKQRNLGGVTGTGTRKPGVSTATNRRTTAGAAIETAKTETKGKPERQAATRTANENAVRPKQRQQAGPSNRDREQNGIGPIAGGDVDEGDYRQTTYASSATETCPPVPYYDSSEGFIPHHRPESRQRKHTGFSPPPELPEPQSRRKPNAEASTKTSSPRLIPSRIPVPITNPVRDSGPPSGRAQLNSPPDRPIRPANFTYLRDPMLDRATGYGSVDLVRTHDVLNPLEANGSLPVSREPSANIQARNAHLKSSNPALYGDPPVQSSQPPTTTRRTPISKFNNHKNPSDQTDPLLNPNVVRDHPTPRQDTILRHLSDIRKGLKLKQMLYESGNYDDEDN